MSNARHSCIQLSGFQIDWDWQYCTKRSTRSSALEAGFLLRMQEAAEAPLRGEARALTVGLCEPKAGVNCII